MIDRLVITEALSSKKLLLILPATFPNGTGFLTPTYFNCCFFWRLTIFCIYCFKLILTTQRPVSSSTFSTSFSLQRPPYSSYSSISIGGFLICFIYFIRVQMRFKAEMFFRFCCYFILTLSSRTGASSNIETREIGVKFLPDFLCL